jgi:predicted RNA-binding protein YlxR (DUF448 family)
MKNIRTCIACRAKKEKYELLRIVSKERTATLDKTYKENARGVYLCKEEADSLIILPSRFKIKNSSSNLNSGNNIGPP